MFSTGGQCSGPGRRIGGCHHAEHPPPADLDREEVVNMVCCRSRVSAWRLRGPATVILSQTTLAYPQNYRHR